MTNTNFIQQAVDTYGTSYQVGDTIRFTAVIAFRTHRSRSKVYGFTEHGPLVTCNGFWRTFQLRWNEVNKVISSN